jgi:hypothetical protein
MAISSPASTCPAAPSSRGWARPSRCPSGRDGPGRALFAQGRRARPAATGRRLVCIEMVHGAAGCSEWGATQHLWSPPAVGRDFDLTPSALKPAGAVARVPDDRQQHRRAHGRGVRAGGDRRRPLPLERGVPDAVAPQADEGSDVYVGTSLDQLYAQRFGQDTPIPSMQLCIENVDQAGAALRLLLRLHRLDQLGVADRAAPDDPRPARRLRHAVRRRRHARGARGGARTTGASSTGSPGEVAQLPARARRRRPAAHGPVPGEHPRDRAAHPAVEARNTSGEERELPRRAAGVPDSFEEHMKLMFDLQVLAFESDMTRVFSFKTGRDASGRVYPESGSTGGSTRRRTTAATRSASSSSTRSTATTWACSRTSSRS